MEVLIILFIFVGMPLFFWNKIQKKIKWAKRKRYYKTKKINRVSFSQQYRNCYQRKSLFTSNEYHELKKLAAYTKANNMEVLAKVRMLDLLEPRSDLKWYKTLLYKIQAKHVDFVVTDTDYNVIAIIELDDTSHKRPDRIRRDLFVNEVLSGVGYKLIRTYSITDEVLQTISPKTNKSTSETTTDQSESNQTSEFNQDREQEELETL